MWWWQEIKGTKKKKQQLRTRGNNRKTFFFRVTTTSTCQLPTNLPLLCNNKVWFLTSSSKTKFNIHTLENNKTKARLETAHSNRTSSTLASFPLLKKEDLPAWLVLETCELKQGWGGDGEGGVGWRRTCYFHKYPWSMNLNALIPILFLCTTDTA